MFGPKKNKEENRDLAPKKKALPKGYTPAKGAPTPRRKDVEAARRRPLVSDTKSLTREERRARKAESRAKSNEIYRKQQEAMRTGDERNMPIQHRGPERRFARDFVDASGPLSAFFMPVALMILPLMFLQPKWPDVIIPIVWTMYGVFLLMTIVAFMTGYRAKLLVEYRFDNVPRGLMLQMVGRAFYLRRWRLPSPQVARGEYPDGGSPADLKAARKARRAKKKGK
ncbi:DUF3043 domain-containing protein [Trueperella bialowiezensis]|uniref:Protein of uncharacterized function (DUF3043) n=1 Tax=Trueperella bialowiezensis TaxID=312285 RepID=A0A448PC70_9ACTO|nr:DUF3043 domain-containing protein [Trueperella bialowiezensis]VEI12538.1 Protein of uncharacterised function (DUF3043) [Trueperella bialowiezensis]